MDPATTPDARGVHDLPGWVRRSWLVPLLLGLAMVLLGLILLFNLDASVETLRWLVVFSLLLTAIDAFATASMRDKPWVGWLVGIAYTAGAVASIVWPGVTLLALVLTVGVSLLVGGALQTVMAWRLRGRAHGWGWSFALGILSVVAGLIFLFGSPVISILVLAIVLAVYVLMTGVTLVALAFAVRKLTTTVEDALRPGEPA
jgi:uncharacterized membrane protein HdeD (DUF308 family)